MKTNVKKILYFIFLANLCTCWIYFLTSLKTLTQVVDIHIFITLVQACFFLLIGLYAWNIREKTTNGWEWIPFMALSLSGMIHALVMLISIIIG